jgi:hypothetical protein
MHKYNRLFFLVLLFLAACKQTSRPGGIIDQERMTKLLTDIHVVDGSVYNMLQMPDSLYKNGTGRYLAVFEKYNTDSIQFKRSFKYYTANPEVMATMYEQIADNLKQKTDSLNKIYQKQVDVDTKRRNDSLSKLPKNSAAPSQTPAQTPVNPSRTSPPHLVPPPRRPNTNQRTPPPRKGNALPVQ